MNKNEKCMKSNDLKNEAKRRILYSICLLSSFSNKSSIKLIPMTMSLERATLNLK